MPQVAWHESAYWLAAGCTMFQFLGIGALLWAFGGLLRRALRRNQPEVRYAVALGLLLATAAIPVGLFVAALNSAGNLAAKRDLQTTAPSQPLIERHQSGPVPSEAGAIGGATPRTRDRTALGSTPLDSSIDWKSALASRWDVVRDTACRWLPWLWLSGAPLILVALACGVNGVDRLRRAGRQLRGGDVVAAHERLRTALRISRHVAIFACDRVVAPILVGILRPAILLPPAVLAGFSPEQMEMILLHELSHVRRCDNLVNLVQRVIEAVLFFHPLVWWLSSWVRLEREECCDRVVVQHTGRPQEYAETLAALAMPGITPRHAAAAIADGHLVTRIRHILKLEDEVMNDRQKTFVSAAGLLIFVGGFAAAFAQQPGVATPSAAQKPSVADAAGGPVSLPSDAKTGHSDAAIGYLEAVQRAIKASAIEESGSLPIVGEVFEGLALDERSAESIPVSPFQFCGIRQRQLNVELVFLSLNWQPPRENGGPSRLRALQTRRTIPIIRALRGVRRRLTARKNGSN
jgi:beta-lactamase regulating signal transducer with metallopeptidase domain